MFQTFEDSPGPANVSLRIQVLRKLMADAKLDAVLVPRADEHQGEYVPPSSERLRWLTGFTGSAGMAVVARKAAALFVDGRYTVQARGETDTEVISIESAGRGKLSQWLLENMKAGNVVGFDPWLHTVNEISSLKRVLEVKKIKLKPLARNPIDKLWGQDRPKPPTGEVIVQPEELAGASAEDKISDVRNTLKKDGAHAAVLTMPDSICWLLNIRGCDIAHNPVALAFAIVPASGRVELFISADKISSDVKKHLSGFARIFQPKELKDRLGQLKEKKRKVRLDPRTAAYWFERTLGKTSVVHGNDPCTRPKAIKTDAEIKGSRAAHERDGLAMVRFLTWLDEHAAGGGVDEIEAVKKLEALRAESGALREVSFPSIAGSGPHGAIVHYRVSEATNRTLQPGELFLVDSGAQYQDGTTDITRTVAIGEPSDEMRRYFTAVLKGHIAIATARFPVGTRGIDLDPFARRALWDIGADFDHGTGHGIGSYLCVHEGPQSISRAGMVVLEPGMLLSNEPGYYAEDKFGIRIENVVLVCPTTKSSEDERETLHFETLTLAPIDLRLVLVDELSEAERGWLNDYHQRVYRALSGGLDKKTKDWLKSATAPI